MHKSKSIKWKDVKHFTKSEFQCSCCNKVVVSPKLVFMLDLARELAGVPFKISSGYRCKKHNSEVGGVKNSAHLKGLAVDIVVADNVSRLKILRALVIVGFSRIGISKGFIHVDVDDSKSDNIWLY